MSSFETENWDRGRLTINKAFAALFQRRGWTTFDQIWSETSDADIAKKLRTDRITLRFTMIDGSEERVFYIKRHVRSSWKEYLKPLLRLTWPILGARPEWNAILRFRESKIPTMTPVALGESGEKSFLITEGLENCTKLSQLTGCSGQALSNTGQRRIILGEVARIARAMHQAGLHHQDFYLGHLMQLRTEPDRIYVIDLGRARYQKKLSLRWIVKDLAQLDYSAEASSLERLRFLREYLGRPLVRTDKRLIRLISAKRRSIARHSAKNRL